MSISKLTVAILIGSASSTALAHGGGLNAEGCHNNRKTGDYHCHRSGGGESRSPQQFRSPAAPSSRPMERATSPAASSLPPGCSVGPRGGTYTITKSGRKNYGGC
ncbi:YHYH domain-containing protein [Aromatoleum toluolicum]|uniref:YHYH domain-containing protein n=1 Tax=Aromatoleum toluolicum TaxID=90060 RepID=A0ABX1NKC1_9RHOO|nr:YHYH domain-containing protein [Aromatoleum toluolicum]